VDDVRAGLIAAVLANPADAAPRLILADRFEETGTLTAAEANLLRNDSGKWEVRRWFRWNPSGNLFLLWAFPAQTWICMGDRPDVEVRDFNFAYDKGREVVALVVGELSGGLRVGCPVCGLEGELDFVNTRWTCYACRPL
jgi:uncharacterized protein (TIGR02996 family)